MAKRTSIAASADAVVSLLCERTRESGWKFTRNEIAQITSEMVKRSQMGSSPANYIKAIEVAYLAALAQQRISAGR